MAGSRAARCASLAVVRAAGVGILFAHGRHTVTTWLRAVGISDDFDDYYCFLARIGRKSESVATQLLTLVLANVPWPERLLAVIDDSPTKRYGPKVEGADIHRNPTPGPADQKYVYGHIWVTISLAVRHPLNGALALPLRSMLYVRQRSMAKIPPHRNWTFRTKLELAAKLLEWIAPIAKGAGKTLWVAVDGFYTKWPFLKRARLAGVVVFQLCLWMHTLVELWAWNRRHDELVNRSDSPWDDPERRPSHANRRKALRQQIIQQELKTIAAIWRLPRKIIQLTERLMALAA